MRGKRRERSVCVCVRACACALHLPEQDYYIAIMTDIARYYCRKHVPEVRYTMGLWSLHKGLRHSSGRNAECA